MEHFIQLETFDKPYGWRAGSTYVEPGANVADIVRYETEELGNKLAIQAPMDYLERIPATDAVWLCKTRQAARYYGNPHKVWLEADAFIAAHDDDGGYLVVNR